MEKAIAILIGNENGELSLRDFLAKVPETIRMRIKPSLLRDKGIASCTFLRNLLAQRFPVHLLRKA